jgi:hypothetical protein
MSARAIAPRWGRAPGRGLRWARGHALELALAVPLALYLLVLTAAPILETLRLSLSAPDGRFPSLEGFRALLAFEFCLCERWL